MRQVEIEGDKPTLSLRVSDYKGDDRELGIGALLAAGLRLAPLFLAVGVSNYNQDAGVHNLACPADHAGRAMAAAGGKNCRHLFSRIECPIGRQVRQRRRCHSRHRGHAQHIAADPARLKLAIVFFAGHGVISNPSKFAFLPQDYVKDDTANVISANDIKDRLGVLQLPGSLSPDSCHSGRAAALDIFFHDTGQHDSKELEKAVQVFEQQKAAASTFLPLAKPTNWRWKTRKYGGTEHYARPCLELLNGGAGVPHMAYRP